MKVQWTQKALDNLRAIHDYIAQDSLFYAMRMVDRLTKRSEQIAFAPYSGRMVPEYQCDVIREVIEGAYRMVYRVNAESIRHYRKPFYTPHT